MQHRFWKSLLAFFLVLVLTIGTVATLSMATAAKTETASVRYSQEVRESQAQTATELSAVVPENNTSPLLSTGAFFLVLVIFSLAVFFTFRSFRMNRQTREAAPPAGRNFRGTIS